MAKSKMRKLLPLLLLLIALAPSSLSIGVQADDLPEQPMISGVLAHNMTDFQAKRLSENGFFVEADVELGEDSRWQTIYSLCKQYNISLIGKLCHNTMNGSEEVPSMSDWVRTIQTSVSNFGDVVKYWEIWNEPTDPKFFIGNASNYAEMLKVANQTIKNLSPDAVVIGLAGLHLYSGEEEWVSKGLDFAKNVTALGGMDHCDAVSLHAYPWGNYTAEVEKAITQSLEQYRNITQKDIWITEAGQHSNSRDHDEKEQAHFLYNSYKLLQSQNVSAYIWYELSETEGDILAEDTFGLFDVDSKPKMSFQTYRLVKSEAAILEEALGYIVRSFNPEVGLVYETPDCDNKTYWVYSDNYLVQLALSHYGMQDESIADLLNTIRNASIEWTKNQSVILNQYQILNCSAFSLPISNASNIEIGRINGAYINCTINNGTGVLSAEDYADIAFLEAIAYQNIGQSENAIQAYQCGIAKWDGTGFTDNAYNSTRGYDTFKLALYICASKTLNQYFDICAYNNLLSCQIGTGASGLENRGGFATYYTENNKTNNQTNTETTALAILALTYEPEPTETPQLPTPTPNITPTPTPTVTLPLPLNPSHTKNPMPAPSPTSRPTPTPTPTATPIPTIIPTTTPITPPQDYTINTTLALVIAVTITAVATISVLTLRIKHK